MILWWENKPPTKTFKGLTSKTLSIALVGFAMSGLPGSLLVLPSWRWRIGEMLRWNKQSLDCQHLLRTLSGSWTEPGCAATEWRLVRLVIRLLHPILDFCCQVEMSNGGKGGRFGRSRSRSPVRRRSPARRSRCDNHHYFARFFLTSNPLTYSTLIFCRSRSRRRRSPSYRSMSRGRCRENLWMHWSVLD